MAEHEPIAIVGIGCLFPGATDLASYWAAIRAARDGISDVPAGHSWRVEDFHSDDPHAPDRSWARRGGFLSPVPFDPLAFGIPPTQLESIDTTQLLSLIAARECLRDAGLDPDGEGWNRERTSVLLGVTGTQELAVSLGSRLHGATWRRSMIRCGVDPALADVVARDIGAHMPVWTEQSFPGLLGNVVAGRIANRLDLGGTNCVVDAACGSSLAAVQVAVDELVLGRADLVLTGGADTLNDAFMFQCFTRTPALSRTNEARPFDADSDGILIGEGIALVALMRASEAREAGRRIYAVIRAVGSSSDGRHRSIYAPNPDGQVRALRRALEAAGTTPEQVGLIEAHGTGTRAGDTAEIEALREVYGPGEAPLRLGSVKSLIGHTKSTAGAAGLVKAALALHERVLPPTAKVRRLNPRLVDTRFDVSDVSDPWVSRDIRRAAVSAFGFGGSNFHAVLEEDEATPPSAFVDDVGLLLVSAPDAPKLDARLAALLDPAPTFAHLVDRCAAGWRPDRFVAAIVADAQSVAARVAEARALVATGGRGDFVFVGRDLDPVAPVVLFPGQGSQYVGMGRAVAVAWPVVRAALDDAERALHASNLPSVARHVFPPHAWSEADRAAREAELQATEHAQPALGALSVAWWRLLSAFGVRPAAVAGHSYGELVALHVAGAWGLDDLLRLSAARGGAMAGAHRGRMAAVSAPLAVLEQATAGTDVVLANRNHPEQGVLAGPDEALAAVTGGLAAAGHTVTTLSVSAAFHSPLVADAVAPLAVALQEASVVLPSVPVWGNATAAPYAGDVDVIRAGLATQITSPVRFAEIVDGLYAEGHRVFVECGPRDVLTRLVHRNLRGRPHVAVAVDATPDATALLLAVATLAAAGVPVDASPLQARRLPAPPRPAGRGTVPIAGANHRNLETLEPPMPMLPPKPAAAAGKGVAVGLAAGAAEGWAAVPSSTAPVAPPPSLALSMTTQAAAPSGDVAAVLDATRRALVAFEELQARTAEVHGRFLDQADRANATFQTLFQAQAAVLLSWAGGAPRPFVAAPAAVLISPAAPPPDVPAGLAALLQANVAPGGGTAVAAAGDLPLLIDARGAVEARTGPAVAPRAPVPVVDLVEIVLGAVARKTGYPREGLELGMDLESDLGVDSIKRVEILSAVQEAAPGLPEIDNARMASLRTLQQVVAALREAGGIPDVPAVLRAPTTLSRDAVVAAVLGAVADKTGYPHDGLRLEMDLESDLGIDSIKRVEILGAVAERLPGLPEPDNGALARLRTLSAVVDHLIELGHGLGFASVGAARAPVDPTPMWVVPPPAASSPVATPATEAPPPPVVAASDVLPRRSLQRRVVGRAPAPRGPLCWPEPIWVDGPDADAVASDLAARGVVTGTGPGGTRVWCGGTVAQAFAAARELALDASLALIGVSVGAAGLARTLAAERPGGRFLAAATVEGLWVTPSVVDVDADGWADVDEAMPVGPARPSPVGPGDWVVVTGGARGVTAAVVMAMARRWRCNWLVLGRTGVQAEPAWAHGVPDAGLLGAAAGAGIGAGGPVRAAAAAVRAGREAAATERALLGSGGAVVRVAVDVRDAAAVAAAVAGRKVAGVVHGAGVLHDRLVADKSDVQWHDVWSTKVDGWNALWTAVAPDGPRFALLFASTSGRYGNRGQADYAAANVFLCEEARRLRGLGVAATAVCWGPWQGGMVDASLARHFEAAGIGAIALDAGAAAAVAEVEGGDAAVVVIEAARPERGRVVRTLDPSAPELAQHALRGKPVWPVAFAAEAMLALGAEIRPDEPLELRDLLVAKGVSSTAAVDLEFRWSTQGSEVAVEVHAEGFLRYKATLAPRGDVPTWAAVRAERAFPRPVGEAQTSWLFHGPLYRRIEAVSGFGDQGIGVEIRPSTPAELGRVAGHWAADPLAVDAVLQAMVLWVRATTGRAALPVGLRRLATFGQLDGPLQVDVRMERRSKGGLFTAVGQRAGQVVLAVDGAWAEDERLNDAFVAPG